MESEFTYYRNVRELSRSAAEFICQLAEECVKKRCIFTLALSGGSTPRTLYELLAQESFCNRIPWAYTHILWGDERHVPCDHHDSNFAMASQALIEHVPVSVSNIHRIPTELLSPDESADAYEKKLRNLFNIFGSLTVNNDWPVFDLILLGMGKDGHTASLFPDSPVLHEGNRWVAATPVPKLNPPVRRITLTFPVINAARNVLFLVSGAEKLPVVRTMLESPGKAWELYPAARVAPAGKLLWFVVSG